MSNSILLMVKEGKASFGMAIVLLVTTLDAQGSLMMEEAGAADGAQTC